MADDKRRFALRENGDETSVFTGKLPRQAALKAARRLDPEDTEDEAVANSERIRLREHGTVDIHIYDAWAWEDDAPADGPAWLGDTVTRANVSKVDAETTTKSEKELAYSRLEPLLIDQPVDVTQEKCGSCGASLEDGMKAVKPVKEVLEPKTVKYKRYHYECIECNTETIAEHTHCPSTGWYGTNLNAQAVLLRYKYRMPYRKIANLFSDLYNIEISNHPVENMCEQMAHVAHSEYEEIQSRIRTADILNVDETPHPVGGSKYWFWIFTTPEETLYAFSDSRGSEVLEEILGENFSGIIVCDGYSAYPAFHSRLQRCWTHLLRGSDNLSEDDTEAWSIYNKLYDIFEGLKDFLATDPTLTQRLMVWRDARRQLEDLVATEVESEKAVEVLTMLENGLGHWLTFVEYPNVSPTNNPAESKLQKPIIIRRIIGKLENEKGMRLHEIFISLLQTWKQQDRHPYSELQRLAQQV